MSIREISKNHEFLCSPSASIRHACPIVLKFCTEFQETLLYKKLSTFFLIVSSSFFKRISLIQNNLLLWKIFKNWLFQNQWNITKRRTPFCCYCYLLRVNVKEYWKNIICKGRRSKKVKSSGFWEYFIIISTKS